MAQDTTTPTSSRTFRASRSDGSALWITLRQPTFKEVELADLERAAKYNQCIRAGLDTRGSMLRVLRKDGRWTDGHREEFERLRDEGQALEKQITADEFENDRQKDEAKTRWREILDRINEMNSLLMSWLGETAEVKADRAEEIWLLVCTAEHAKYDDRDNRISGDRGGDRIWEDLDAYVGDTDESLRERIEYEFSTFRRGEDSEWDKLMALRDKGDEADEELAEEVDDAIDAPIDESQDEPQDEPIADELVAEEPPTA